MNKTTLYNWQLKIIVKNIFTATVALMLLIGSTGFQVYKHTCDVHNFSAASLTESPVCEKDHQVIEETDDCCKTELEKIVEPNCCESDPIDESNSVSISSQDIKCCVSSIVSSQLNDNLFSPREKKILSVELITTLVPFIEKKLQQAEQNLVLLYNDLPPPKFGKRLLQTIHQLKIDTPIC